MEAINPRVDIAFKKIFGIEENKDLLISLINSIVGEEDQVVDITLLNPYNQKNFKSDKLSVLDIKAKGSTGKRFNIEIQITDEGDYDKRALYYWARLYTEQLETAQDYSTLEKVIGIHILNFTSIPKAEKYHNVFHITEKETNFHFFKDLELHTIELKKFTDSLSKELEGMIPKIQNSLDMWSAFLTRNNLLKVDKLPKPLDTPELKKALNVLNVMNFNSEEREAYENHLKWLRIETNTLKKAEEKGVKKGIQQGIKQGLKQGIEQGLKQGMDQGLELGTEQGIAKGKREVALALLKQSLSIGQISEATGLSEEEIDQLSDPVLSRD
ncbi:Rpn family recombination-promoting nuclease/putative transposase [Candidatus Neptunochlamydia vexilliferae]|nr:Rpn family recombination-promoting nuclease/putative transposase [Candidatus Neptunochlamydia vexilliferae]